MVGFAPEITGESVQSRIQETIERQRAFFATGKTKDIEFRLAQLKALRKAVIENQDRIVAAVKADLNKPDLEAYAFEVAVVQEIDHAIKHLRGWLKPKAIPTPPQHFPAKARVYPEPLGVVLIISPWNYPFLLAIAPLVGALAAGNCVLLKPSEVSSHTSRAIAEIVGKTFDPAYIAVVEGGVEVSQAVLAEKFDHIFFTGGTEIGRIVMAAAARHLTPVTLELGGKSPCIVDTEISLETTAKRIVWGKFINAGQTCIAPDYLLVDRRIKPALLQALKDCIREFYGEDPYKSPDFARIISAKHFSRLAGFLGDGTIVAGGQTSASDRYIAPTILDNVSLSSPIMQEEIFGPILPAIEYTDIQEAIDLINSKPKPLALYLFSKNTSLQRRILTSTSSGGICINDTILHAALSEMPFGGVGDSGMGSYHGKKTFETFSHFKSVLAKPFWLDLPWRYAPYAGKLETIKWMIGK
ncbi:aldehyde dehydrogenase [Pannus brasiliensis CCIBt3594]|uniref:Aldehyde dehydrogenase n=1 Tax=Pannus brasiliensis CCIBt3594 TaxID=1427578 RepID=A0AAW9QWL3_9CHRO